MLLENTSNIHNSNKGMLGNTILCCLHADGLENRTRFIANIDSTRAYIMNRPSSRDSDQQFDQCFEVNMVDNIGVTIL